MTAPKPGRREPSGGGLRRRGALVGHGVWTPGDGAPHGAVEGEAGRQPARGGLASASASPSASREPALRSLVQVTAPLFLASCPSSATSIDQMDGRWSIKGSSINVIHNHPMTTVKYQDF
jgi:hypothetical protein